MTTQASAAKTKAESAMFYQESEDGALLHLVLWDEESFLAVDGDSGEEYDVHYDEVTDDAVFYKLVKI